MKTNTVKVGDTIILQKCKHKWMNGVSVVVTETTYPMPAGPYAGEYMDEDEGRKFGVCFGPENIKQ